MYLYLYLYLSMSPWLSARRPSPGEEALDGKPSIGNVWVGEINSNHAHGSRRSAAPDPPHDATWPVLYVQKNGMVKSNYLRYPSSSSFWSSGSELPATRIVLDGLTHASSSFSASHTCYSIRSWRAHDLRRAEQDRQRQFASCMRTSELTITPRAIDTSRDREDRDCHDGEEEV